MSYGTLQIEKMTTESGYSLGAGNASSFKNRIINGGMTIDQRNSGASVTITANDTYTLDRWSAGIPASSPSKMSIVQSSTAPTGFSKSLLVTSLTALSVSSGDFFSVYQHIEGYNCADLMWGSASAKTVTLSFWVYSSLTGTFGGALQNSDRSRSYPFTYTISSANTWEQKSITITGDTTGTWNTTNGKGISVVFGMAVGSTYLASSGSWAAGNYWSATGATNILATNGATWYVSGVQFETGTVATSFDFRSYGTELALCQRYCYVIRGNATATSALGIGYWNTTTDCRVGITPKVSLRTTPTLIYSSVSDFSSLYAGIAYYAASSVSLAGETCSEFINLSLITSGGVQGQASQSRIAQSTSAYVGFTAEL